MVEFQIPARKSANQPAGAGCWFDRQIVSLLAGSTVFVASLHLPYQIGQLAVRDWRRARERLTYTHRVIVHIKEKHHTTIVYTMDASAVATAAVAAEYIFAYLYLRDYVSRFWVYNFTERVPLPLAVSFIQHIAAFFLLLIWPDIKCTVYSFHDPWCVCVCVLPWQYFGMALCKLFSLFSYFAPL